MKDTKRPAHEFDPKFIAGVDMLGRTGATQFQIRYADDEKPIVWFAVVIYKGNMKKFETAAASHPVEAVMRLCQQVIDGGTCTHCGRPTAFDADHDDTVNEQFNEVYKSQIIPGMPTEGICWTMWDPELSKFRRACE